MKKPTPHILQKLFDLIVYQKNGCWLYGGARTKEGYGTIQFKNKTFYIHRIIWECFKGPIPTDLKILHKCDVPRCGNPEHLFLGTQRDNIMDSVKKGRWRNKNNKKTTKVLTTPIKISKLPLDKLNRGKEMFTRITNFSHEKLKEEITRRRAAGEVPKPTFESVIEEMVIERQKKIERTASRQAEPVPV